MTLRPWHARDLGLMHANKVPYLLYYCLNPLGIDFSLLRYTVSVKSLKNGQSGSCVGDLLFNPNAD